ncbi:endoglucanase [Alicyclobacillus sacchari]|uniref:glycoside hydrolase family 5 protein n=1 Tax=Alicyclobacillus sacchari TaxID=392010 RepID=UPI0023EA2C00|nr:cellulase family glycosylhydrolase [Alicyclobacillus sacchari]GMA58138.1 endoglucanase [Alicyclobacillus sacchari]
MPSTFMSGVNLGGWISQYWQASKEHFDTFIREEDITRIASWGMDHVRLPLDYPVIESDLHPGIYLEEGLHYIDNCLEWCQKHGLGLVLDLHRAPGYSFGTLDTNTLFDDESDQQRFIAIWEMLTKRYRGTRDQLWFELMNEVVDATSERWNRLAHRTIRAIREIDPERIIVYGGNHYNSIDELRHIELVPNDNRIVYTFHFYKPHLFTHQKASWSEAAKLYNQTINYPGRFPGLAEFLDSHPEFGGGENDLAGTFMDKALLQHYLQPTVEFMERSGHQLYCGEYGVIDEAPLTSRIGWHRDIVELLRNLGIGRACWSYKEMNFGLVNKAGRVVYPELVRIVSAH